MTVEIVFPSLIAPRLLISMDHMFGIIVFQAEMQYDAEMEIAFLKLISYIIISIQMYLHIYIYTYACKIGC